MGLKTGSDGPAFGVSYFDPLTGQYGSPVRYRQHIDAAKHTSHWLPPGLTMGQVKAGPKDYKAIPAAHGVPGLVWVKG